MFLWILSVLRTRRIRYERKGDAITGIKGETRGSLCDPEESGWRENSLSPAASLSKEFPRGFVPEGGIPFRPSRPRSTVPRSREKSLARDGFNDFWGLPGMAPFLRTGEGGRGVRGIFKPLLSVGTLFSGTLSS